MTPPSPQHGKEKGNELGYVLAMLLRGMALHLLFEFNLKLYGWCAMTDKLLIKRELLERIDESAICDGTDATISDDLFTQLVAALATPRQPEGDYGWLVNLELPEAQCNCAWNPDSHDKTCPVYLRDRMADARRAIAELRDRLDVMTQCADNYSRMFE